MMNLDLNRELSRQRIADLHLEAQRRRRAAHLPLGTHRRWLAAISVAIARALRLRREPRPPEARTDAVDAPSWLPAPRQPAPRLRTLIAKGSRATPPSPGTCDAELTHPSS